MPGPFFTLKNSRVLLFAALLIFIVVVVSIKTIHFKGRDQRPFRVLGTVPKSMETGFARDQAILIYLDRPLPANQTLSSPFTGVVYRKAGDPADGIAATGTATILPSRKAIAFVPVPPLKEGRFDTANYNYELDVSYATTGLPVVPYTISFSTVGLFDTTGIWAQQASPEDDAIDVDPTYHPFLLMNEPLDPATIQSSNILMKDAAGKVVATTVSFDYTNNALSIVPSTALLPNTVYIVTAGLGFKSMAGQTFQWPYTWQFTTKPAPTPPDLASPKPYVVKIEPAAYSTGVPPTSPVTVYFSQPIDPNTLTAQTVHLRAYGQAVDLPAELSYSGSDHSLKIQPVGPLPGSTAISLDLDAGNILSAAHDAASLQSGVNTPSRFFTSPPVASPSPPPAQTAVDDSPQLKAYLAAHDQLMRDEAAFMDEHQADDPATRQAALNRWRQENAPRFQQLQEESSAMARKASAPAATATPSR